VILSGLSDENEGVREVALRSGQVLIDLPLIIIHIYVYIHIYEYMHIYTYITDPSICTGQVRNLLK
jgi:hypothetical protein